MTAPSAGERALPVLHTLILPLAAKAPALDMSMFLPSADDYVRDPRRNVPVSRFGVERPAVHRETVADAVYDDDGERVSVRRTKDNIDRMRERGELSDNAYAAVRKFQMQYERMGYERCSTVNYDQNRGGHMGVEDVYARATQARDYVYHTFAVLGGAGSAMSVAVAWAIGRGKSLRKLKEEGGRTVDYWSGVLNAALELMEKEYVLSQKSKAKTRYKDYS